VLVVHVDLESQQTRNISNGKLVTAAHILMNADVAFQAFQITAWVPTSIFLSHCVEILIVIRLHRPIAIVNFGYHLFSQSFALVMPLFYHSHFEAAFFLCQFYESLKVVVLNKF